ncbi:MAG TPA: DHA2 family efflux MFS transporter permease subunit [Solirubrobacteraceae bacterium]|jgi:EmrB/QacA subfamily drug resistance transporter|nr:DHA2 family efflux MFS transporter permease subunit [Solirubrobacteraceae bacterium]
MLIPVAAEGSQSEGTRRWAVLALVGVAQLMVVLDATIVNIALPSAQRALGFSTTSRQWVVTAYALAFGSLLLLGGKLADLFGRKWTFIAGLVGFSIASALGGFAQSFEMLVAARTLQGAFGALLAPSALSLLTVTFAGSRDRAKAFGIFGAIAGGGASVGLVLGGILTQTLSWRWCLFVNLVIAVPTLLAALRLLENHRPEERPHIDIPGALLAGGGLFSLVYGFSNAETHGWTAPLTIGALAASVVLLVAFAAVENTTRDPLLPLHIVRDRARGGAYLSILLAGAGVFAVFLFLTFYLQQSLGFSPITTGLAFLPLTATLVVTSTTVQTKLLARTGAKPLVAAGMALALIAMLWLTRLRPGAGYAAHVLPALLVTGVGIGCIFAPAFSTATLGVARSEAGVASAMVNTSQQVGGSVGTALLSTVFASAVTAYATSHRGQPGLANAAAIHGYTTAFAWAAAIFAVGFLLALLVLPAKDRAAGAAPVPEPAPERAREPAPGPAREPVPAPAPAVAPAISPAITVTVTAVVISGPCSAFGLATVERHRSEEPARAG